MRCKKNTLKPSKSPLPPMIERNNMRVLIKKSKGRTNFTILIKQTLNHRLTNTLKALTSLKSKLQT